MNVGLGEGVFMADLPEGALAPAADPLWYKDAIIYQLHVKAFYDSNGDGIGDFPGLTDRLDYIKDLGVNTIWLSPIFASPQHDMGYDILDYRSIHEPYGTVEDVQSLIDQLHSNDMRLLMDLVVNHTSDEHAWFKESRSSKDNAKRDWYFWRPPRYDADGTRRPPNNWKSRFQGT